MTETATTARIWDRLYQEGRYVGEPPIPFVGTILENLTAQDREGYGLYVGCGNGRNYIPLVQAGLKLHGMDASRVGIEQIREREPDTANATSVADFGNYNGANIFDYLITIQVFQHGDRARAHNFFQRAASALKPSGKLFLRVNSVSSDLVYEHRRVEGSDRVGKTILCKGGPKENETLHYYSRLELIGLAEKYDFSVIQPLVEVTEEREPPLTGSWTQWETVWRKE